MFTRLLWVVVFYVQIVLCTVTCGVKVRHKVCLSRFHFLFPQLMNQNRRIVLTSLIRIEVGSGVYEEVSGSA